MLNSLEFAQEYCWKYGQKKLNELLDSCGESSQTTLEEWE